MSKSSKSQSVSQHWVEEINKHVSHYLIKSDNRVNVVIKSKEKKLTVQSN